MKAFMIRVKKNDDEEIVKDQPEKQHDEEAVNSFEVDFSDYDAKDRIKMKIWLKENNIPFDLCKTNSFKITTTNEDYARFAKECLSKLKKREELPIWPEAED